MWNVIRNFIPTDKDINLFCDYVGYEIDNADINNVFVYLTKIEDINLCCAGIGTSVEASKDKISCQRNAGLQLLKYAVKDRWGIDEDLGKIKVSENGKPYTEGYQFSISHCGGLVCVAISRKEVGVDLECVTTRRNWQGLSRRVLTIEEKGNSKFDSQTMTELWTKKEAVFKLRGDNVFSPSSIDPTLNCTDTIKNISLEDNDYVLTLATKEITNNYLIVKKAFFNKNKWELE